MAPTAFCGVATSAAKDSSKDGKGRIGERKVGNAVLPIVINGGACL